MTSTTDPLTTLKNRLISEYSSWGNDLSAIFEGWHSFFPPLFVATVLLTVAVNLFELFLQESGTPLKVTVRMQINMALGDLSAMAHTPQFSNMVLPLLWTEIVSNIHSVQFSRMNERSKPRITFF